MLGDPVWLNIDTRKRYARYFYNQWINLYGDHPLLIEMRSWILYGVVSTSEALLILRGKLPLEKAERYENLRYYLSSGFLSFDDIKMPDYLDLWPIETKKVANTIEFQSAGLVFSYEV